MKKAANEEDEQSSGDDNEQGDIPEDRQDSARGSNGERSPGEETRADIETVSLVFDQTVNGLR